MVFSECFFHKKEKRFEDFTVQFLDPELEGVQLAAA